MVKEEIKMKKKSNVNVKKKSKRDVALAMACIGGSIPPGLMQEIEKENKKEEKK
jgi:hypothetical protein